ncbi:QacE family quaternary ammonium compound efflux SMR transporter [Hahella sp. CCB-MM4]|uniref:DMT family transporter n=1 Tax=Hahella sp. (strain CCB-MM4) TaxID=1926491 RepID=UPI000B9AFC5E|nr:multidrug efflux SMR transporter [Hahella sp. CCB-MM4]OZG70958.1 QacE family quaternary ammonium compound efflux SMR transporter [Hahella sp. CCB-MM4]
MLKLSYLYLLVAIIFEVVGTTALKYSQQFTRLWPSLLVVLCYGAAFYLLALSLRQLNVGIAYAIWSGVGIVCIALIQVLWFRQWLDAPAMAGIALIIIGVMIINVFSNTVTH